MRIILVAGGSGGHIYPCLELAKYLESKGHIVLLCGARNSLEEKIYKDNGLDFKGVDISKNKFISCLKNYKPLKRFYKRFYPDSIILFGNYISFPYALSAIALSIPIYLHEQNVVFGKCNQVLASKAKKIFLSLPIEDNKYKNKSFLVGNPKSDVDNKKYHKYQNKYNVVIVMGSLGSSSVNEILKEFINICNDNVDYHLVVGNKYYKKFVSESRIRDNVHIYPYLDNLVEYMRSCDVFISRAGATTISEIITNRVASILIPSPYVKNNHQYKNAKYLLDNKACKLILENDLSASKLNEEINNLIFNYKECLKLKNNAKSLAISNTNKKIYKELLKDDK